ncbi:hypothetical protein SAMD00023353_5500370 [Rosellinia necatrix]|uniref:Uncharacterized protein n=1 Tax=Rosellinia necatrix TaxID=77044 RepID=A0A1W2TQX2_ROSNE|nr:hypothetical protein SAMD00023353_5500370 [Rosellinia necatrix]
MWCIADSICCDRDSDNAMAQHPSISPWQENGGVAMIEAGVHSGVQASRRDRQSSLRPPIWIIAVSLIGSLLVAPVPSGDQWLREYGATKTRRKPHRDRNSITYNYRHHAVTVVLIDLSPSSFYSADASAAG